MFNFKWMLQMIFVSSFSIKKRPFGQENASSIRLIHLNLQLHLTFIRVMIHFRKRKKTKTIFVFKKHYSNLNKNRDSKSKQSSRNSLQDDCMERQNKNKSQRSSRGRFVIAAKFHVLITAEGIFKEKVVIRTQTKKLKENRKFVWKP